MASWQLTYGTRPMCPVWNLKGNRHLGVHLFCSLCLTVTLMRQRRNSGPEEMEKESDREKSWGVGEMPDTLMNRICVYYLRMRPAWSLNLHVNHLFSHKHTHSSHTRHVLAHCADTEIASKRQSSPMYCPTGLRVAQGHIMQEIRLTIVHETFTFQS